jgi:hypothetical protein
MTDKSEFVLDDLFAEIRAIEVVPSAAVQARMMDDAQRIAAVQGVQHRPDQQTKGWFSRLPDLFGGWSGLGGLTACAAFGIGLSVVQPAGITGLFSAQVDSVAVSVGLDADPLSLFGG